VSAPSCVSGAPPTEESGPQAHAAALTHPKISLTDGRSVRPACQQSSTSFQTLSERPSSGAFGGFKGLSPPKTLVNTSDVDSLANGGVPVSTYTGRIGKCTSGLVRCPPHRSPSQRRTRRPPSKACTRPIQTWMEEGVLVPCKAGSLHILRTSTTPYLGSGRTRWLRDRSPRCMPCWNSRLRYWPKQHERGSNPGWGDLHLSSRHV